MVNFTLLLKNTTALCILLFFFFTFFYDGIKKMPRGQKCLFYIIPRERFFSWLYSHLRMSYEGTRVCGSLAVCKNRFCKKCVYIYMRETCHLKRYSCAVCDGLSTMSPLEKCHWDFPIHPCALSVYDFFFFLLVFIYTLWKKCERERVTLSSLSFIGRAIIRVLVRRAAFYLWALCKVHLHYIHLLIQKEENFFLSC